jgi:hypothetical protein
LCNNNVLSFCFTNCSHYSAANYIILTAQMILIQASCYHSHSFSLKLPHRSPVFSPVWLN